MYTGQQSATLIQKQHRKVGKKMAVDSVNVHSTMYSTHVPNSFILTDIITAGAKQHISVHAYE